MLVKSKAIVISALKYQEKSLIVKCFTQTDGLTSYFVRNAFASKSAFKYAFFQSLTILEIEASHKNKGTLEHFREVRIAVPFRTIHTDVFKSTMVLFVSEVLQHAIREEEKNETLFTFLETALQWLDTHETIANFHLVLLLEATKYLGFYPDVTNQAPAFFEMTEGVFSDMHAISSLTAEETQLLRRLMTVRFDHDQKLFSASERRRLLKILMEYYALHLEGFRQPNSLVVLQEVFA